MNSVDRNAKIAWEEAGYLSGEAASTEMLLVVSFVCFVWTSQWGSVGAEIERN